LREFKAEFSNYWIKSKVVKLALVSFFVALGYSGVFVLILILNIIPAFMPPTWMVLSLIYISFPRYFTSLPLALVGCVASTLGRFILSYIGTASRGVMSEGRKGSLDKLRKTIESKKGGGFLLSFAVALSPLPSNAYFIAVGMMRYQVLEIFVGFMLGRLLSYWFMINLTTVAAHSLEELFSNEFYTVTIIDFIGIGSAIFLALIDWDKLIKEKRLGIINPKLRRH
jgi:membrane protein YqaA with SNARE-associated domain